MSTHRHENGRLLCSTQLVKGSDFVPAVAEASGCHDCTVLYKGKHPVNQEFNKIDAPPKKKAIKLERGAGMNITGLPFHPRMVTRTIEMVDSSAG